MRRRTPQRSRLATAGLAALRSKHPSRGRHTGAATYPAHEAQGTLEKAGPYGYQQRPACPPCTHRLPGNGQALSAPEKNPGRLITPHAHPKPSLPR